MATYTMTMEDALEISGGSYEIVKGIAVIDKPELLGLSTYPIFDEDYRETLNSSIFEYYRYEEIGVETPEMFVQRLRTRMHLLMPTYNEMYRTNIMAKDSDILSQIDMKTKGESESLTKSVTDSTATSQAGNTSESTAESRAVNHLLPQSQLAGNGDYASSGADSTSGSSSDSEATEESASNVDATGSLTGVNDSSTTGRQTSVASLVNEYRAIVLNVDMMIITDLEDLFMGLWGTTQPYTTRSMY